MKWHFSCEGREYGSPVKNYALFFLSNFLSESVLIIFFLFSRTREVPNWSRSGFYDLIRPDLSGRSTVSGPVKSFLRTVSTWTHVSRFFSRNPKTYSKLHEYATNFKSILTDLQYEKSFISILILIN